MASTSQVFHVTVYFGHIYLGAFDEFRQHVGLNVQKAILPLYRSSTLAAITMLKLRNDFTTGGGGEGFQHFQVDVGIEGSGRAVEEQEVNVLLPGNSAECVGP